MPIFRILDGSFYELSETDLSSVLPILFKRLEISPSTHYIKIIDPTTQERLKLTDTLENREYFVLAQPFFVDWIDASKLDPLWITFNPSPTLIEYIRNIPKEDIHWESLSKNPHVIEFLLENSDKIDISICENTHPKAIQYIKKQIDFGVYERLKERWVSLSANPSALPLFMEYPHLFDWECIKKHNPNPDIMPLLIEKWKNGILTDESMRKLSIKCCESPDTISYMEEYPIIRPWKSLSKNPHPTAFQWIKENGKYHDDLFSNTNPDALRYAIEETIIKNKFIFVIAGLSSFYTNPSIVLFINKYKSTILSNTYQYSMLSSNEYPGILPYIEEAHDRGLLYRHDNPNVGIEGNMMLSCNPVMIDFLEKHPEYINYKRLSMNPSIFL